MLAVRARQTTTTTGTGSVTLADPPTAYVALSSAFAVGVAFQYAIESSTAYEYGWGKLTSASVLSRDRVEISSNSNALVDFGEGIKTVRCAPWGMTPGFPPAIPSFSGGSKIVKMWNTATVVSSGGVGPSGTSGVGTEYFRTYWPGGPKISGFALFCNSTGTLQITYGIYSVDGYGWPKAKLAESAAITTASTGLRTGALGAAIRLRPGWYCIGASDNAGGTGTFRGYFGTYTDRLKTSGSVSSYAVIGEAGTLPATAGATNPPTLISVNLAVPMWVLQ